MWIKTAQINRDAVLPCGGTIGQLRQFPDLYILLTNPTIQPIFCNQPKTNAVFIAISCDQHISCFFVIHTTHIKPSLNLDDLPPRRKQFWFVDQGVGAWCSQWPGARNPCLFQNIKYFSSGNKTPKDRLNIQVPGLAVPGGTWFTRLVQSGDKNSAYSLFRYI